MARERNAEARVDGPEPAPEVKEFKGARPTEAVSTPDDAAGDKGVVETDVTKVEENVSDKPEDVVDAVRDSRKSLNVAAQKRGVDLEAVGRRLAADPNAIYRLDQEEDEAVDPAAAANVAEGQRLAVDAIRREQDAFPEFDNVDPLIRTRDALQVQQENAHFEGLARVLSGAVKDEAGVPAIDENNLPPEELDRRAKLAAASSVGGHRRRGGAEDR